MMTKTAYLILALMILLCHFIQSAESQHFTSIVGLKASLEAESEYAKEVNLYIAKEYKRLENLSVLSQSLLEHSKKISVDIKEHLAHPVNAYLLISDMFNLTTQIQENIILSKQHENGIKSLKAHFIRQELYSSTFHTLLPTKEDLDGAIDALFRIQDTYELSTERLADGSLGYQTDYSQTRPLSAHDCYTIGANAMLSSDYYHCVQWMSYTLELYDKTDEENRKEVPLDKVLDYLNYALSVQGNVERAHAVVKRWLEFNSNSTHAINNKAYYESVLQEKNVTVNADAASLPPLKNTRNRTGQSETYAFKVFEMLCRGQRTIHKPERLMCHLVHHGDPLLILSPAKEEELRLEPRLVFYHHVLTDSEVEVIKSMSLPLLSRSGVFAYGKTPDGGQLVKDRISKSAWLWDHENEVVKKVSRKVSAVTQLSLNHAEALQVLNYGIGGHYNPHHDFATPENIDAFSKEAGNRLATFILYLSDVDMGGATAFPLLGAAVWPEKGGAAFWYNLLPNGDLDSRTLHGACPVIVGYKWVCNKWLHVGGNENHMLTLVAQHKIHPL